MWLVLAPTLKWLGLILLFVFPLAGILTWAERRQSAMIQDRLGPNRANIGPLRLWGLLHFVADALKMMFKEDFVPRRVHRVLYALAPIFALAPVLIAFAVIPFGPDVDLHRLGEVASRGRPIHGEPLQVLVADWGLLFYLAVASLANYGAAVGGWASYSKWAMLGALRATSQMMAYEVAIGLCLVGMFVVTGTLEPGAMVRWQIANVWGIVVQPVAALLFFVAAIAETKRTPFDIPEGESEIVGYFIEYSGLRFGMFYLGEFMEVVFAGALMTTVFFGGWHLPGLHADGWHAFGWQWLWPHGAVVLASVAAFGLKVVVFCWLQLMIRWTVPRFRPDQLLALGWKKLLPLALVNLMVTSAFLVRW